MSNKMFLKIFILVSVFVSYVVSNSCVTFDFEDGFYDLFGYKGICSSHLPLWHVSEYRTLGLASPDRRSSKCITPQLQRRSCTASFDFIMNAGGTFEFNIYMAQAAGMDEVMVEAYHIGPDGIHFVVGVAVVRDQIGWDVVKMPLTGGRSFTGYIVIYGYSSRNSTVLIDSFRYIPPGVDPSSCQIYG